MINNRPYVKILVGTDVSEFVEVTKEQYQEFEQQIKKEVENWFNLESLNIGIEIIFNGESTNDKVEYSNQSDNDTQYIEDNVYEIFFGVQANFLDRIGR
jgi:hypothetical protein